MEVVKSRSKEGEPSRKRRRSELEEAVITIIDSTPLKEKRRRTEPDLTQTQVKKWDTRETKPKVEVPENPKNGSTIQLKSKETGPPPSSSEIGKKNKDVPIARTKTPKSTDTDLQLSKEKDNDKTPSKQKVKSGKSEPTEKDKATPQDDKKPLKRKISKSNKSLNISSVKAETKIEKSTNNVNKEKSKNSKEKINETDKVTTEKNSSEKSRSASSDCSWSIRDRIVIDDDTSLAAIARRTSKDSEPILPDCLISDVRSLATQSSDTSKGKKTRAVEPTVEAHSDSSVFTPTSTDPVRNMQDAKNRIEIELQKQINENEHPVGRVGVRAFARMTSPPAPVSVPEVIPNNNLLVEIKTEPIDYDGPERHMEKMDLMNAFKLRPVNPTNLREVRINKVVVTPLARMLTPNQPNKPIELRPRAKKTFPQPKKTDDRRSELNSKNSMVYIPIQPPVTQAPIRMQRPATNGPTSNSCVSKTITTINTSTGN